MKKETWIVTFEFTTLVISQWKQEEVKHSVEHALRTHFGSLPYKVLKVEKNENNGE